jgi:hypothetical protein
MITVYLDGSAGIGTQDHQNTMYRPAFETHPAFELVDDPDKAEVVCVAVPLADRAGTILRYVEAGKHVLADKPLAATLGECSAIAGAARSGRPAPRCAPGGSACPGTCSATSSSPGETRHPPASW